MRIEDAIEGTPCSLHRTHQPHVTYCELHHVIPQSWQVLYVPATFTGARDANWPDASPSPDRPGVMLWDGRTDPICRTGHGNTHWYLVKLMRFMSELPGSAYVVQLTFAKTQLRHSYRPADLLAIHEALQALSRFTAAGGSLAALWARGEWGEI